MLASTEARINLMMSKLEPEQAKDVVPFVFNMLDKYTDEKTVLSIKESIEKGDEVILAMPHRKCLIIGDGATVIDLSTDDSEKVLHFDSLIVEEVSPDEFRFIAMTCESIKGSVVPNSFRMYLMNKNDDNDGTFYRIVCESVSRYMMRLRDSKFGIVKTNIRVKSKTSEGTKFVKIKSVTYIQSRSGSVNEVDDNQVRKKIEWSESFLVGGHWRRVAGVGKNRLGEYNQEGFTWVVEHVRGDGDLKIKTRIVKCQ